MVGVSYNFFGRDVNPTLAHVEVPEIEQEALTFDDFEEAKSRYRELSSRFNLLAGCYKECNRIMKLLDYAESDICELELMRRGLVGITQTADTSRRKRIEDYFIESSPFQYILSDVFRNIDMVSDMLSGPVEQGQYPALRAFDYVNNMCDLDIVVESGLETARKQDEIRQQIEDAVKNANLSEGAIKFLTTKELMEVLLVSRPKADVIL